MGRLLETMYIESLLKSTVTILGYRTAMSDGDNYNFGRTDTPW